MSALDDNLSKSWTSVLEGSRVSLGSVGEIIPIPPMLEDKRKSFAKFLNTDAGGLKGVFESVFPITDYAGKATLEFLNYSLEEIGYTPLECIDRDMTYAVKLRISIRLIVWADAIVNKSKSDGQESSTEPQERKIKSIKEQSVYMCNMPMMTKDGTFIINGAEHVIVSQMHRSPGVFFDGGSKSSASVKPVCSARVIPYRGSWLDFESDAKDLLYFRIDRKRKIGLATLFIALGMTNSEILNSFYKSIHIERDKGKKGVWYTELLQDKFEGVRLNFDIIDFESKEIVLKSGIKLSKAILNMLINVKKVKHIVIPEEFLIKLRSATDIKTEDNIGEVVLIEVGDLLTIENLNKLEAVSLSSVEALLIDEDRYSTHILNTFLLDKGKTQDDALSEIYKIVRASGIISIESVRSVLNNLFFDSSRYDLSEVGRIKINNKLNLKIDLSTTVLTLEDIIAIVKELVNIMDGISEPDDIDHLGNRRVKSLNELIENQVRIGLVKVAKSALERMSVLDLENAMPYDLINPRMVSSSTKEFYAGSQLCQFMDQTNPLSEITHKRRISALGPGGLSRERAGFEVRDVHYTHFGRQCTTETPEGQNIGLINSLALYARVNKHGFIETPYRIVKNGYITKDIVYLSADEESGKNIASIDVDVDHNGKICTPLVLCRNSADFVLVKPEEVDYTDVSTKQTISVAAALIPFLENNDANRALMGSNMQRQAVPLVKPNSPVVGTGIEQRVAFDSGALILAKRDGVVDYVDSKKIIISSVEKSPDSEIKIDVYNLYKWRRTNFNTSINHIPTIIKGSVVKKGDVIADGAATQGGELALGNNVTVAYMSWRGNNFEDSVIFSLGAVNKFSSIHVEEFECIARDTRLGPEEITADISNLGDELLSKIDENGIARIGARVSTGDIIVGKTTPKNEVPVTPEEKLLRAVFGETSVNVKDSSLRVPVGISGVVVDVKVLFRKGIEQDSRTLAISKEMSDELHREKDCKARIIQTFSYRAIRSLLIGQKILSCSSNKSLKGVIIDDHNIVTVLDSQLFDIVTEDDVINKEISYYKSYCYDSIANIEKEVKKKMDILFDGVDLPNGVLRIVKVFIATFRRLQPGDKVSGRHGNKGVVSRIVPVEDMPFLEDGTPVDVILNPLGVPSRMNVGQILETHLGLACTAAQKKIQLLFSSKQENWRDQIQDLLFPFYKSDDLKNSISSLSENDFRCFIDKLLKNGIKVAVPAFDSVRTDDLSELLLKTTGDSSGQLNVYDGYTGKLFNRKITVGCLYILKLHHLVDSKIHARSTGPYSLITQQPLGGKAQFGGQRFGEMEVWALEAYGAANTLKEILTVKSDDVKGRIMVYEAIINGKSTFECGIPESFNVMIKELMGLCVRISFD